MHIIGSGFGQYGYKPALDLCDSHDGIVIAVPPSDQPRLARAAMKKTNLLLLEKPLAESPEEAQMLLDDLKKWSGKFRIGYIFQDCEWAKRGLDHISWDFMAYHYSHGLDNWKRRLGVVRLYGIHLIGLLAYWGYSGVLYSKASESEWNAIFTGEGLLPCQIRVDSRSRVTSFRAGEEYSSPWGKETRVEVLARSLKKFFAEPQPDWYQDSIHLWAKVEAA